MKTGVTPLYPNEAVAKRVTDYSESHSSPLPEHITAYHAHISSTHKHSNYMISDFQGQSQVLLARLAGARRVLEIGVFVGYSALVWAHAVGPEGSVTGLEFSEEYAGVAREAFDKYGVKNVEVIEGDARELLSKLTPSEPYDLIFIDAEKSGYPGYLDAILSRSQPSSPPSTRLLKKGGLIVADNVLRRGLVADDSQDNPYASGKKILTAAEYQKDNDVEAVREFNKKVVESKRLDNWLMPLYDGVNVAILRD